MTTREQIIAAANEAGCAHANLLYDIAENIEELRTLAFEAGRSFEREECAKVCDVDRRLVAMQERIEELERERDEAVSAVQRLSSGQPFEAVVIADVVKRRTAAIEREHDALQADNARLREALEKCSIQLTALGFSANHADEALAKVRKP